MPTAYSVLALKLVTLFLLSNMLQIIMVRTPPTYMQKHQKQLIWFKKSGIKTKAMRKVWSNNNSKPKSYQKLIQFSTTLTYKMPDISLAVGLDSHSPMKLYKAHMMTTKKILYYINGTFDYDIFCSFPK